MITGGRGHHAARRGGLRSAVVAQTVALAGGGAAASAFTPRGPAAAAIANLWWAMLAIAVIVCLAVFILFFVAIAPRRRPSREPPSWSIPFVVTGGIALPLVILVGLLVWSLAATNVLAVPAGTATTIRVIGHQWWWEVHYPDEGVVTANELRIPAGVPVRLELTSEDVIHSFWVPELHGKMDLIPGQVNEFWLQADEPGIYRGHCAEFCGVQHARMNFMVVADPPETYEAWLAAQRESAPEPTTLEALAGRQAFLGSACVYCHTIRGTNASGTIGPDLTHLAGRLTLGAGAIANNRGNLAGWIVNSQAIKPGNRMPPMYLDSEQLQALLTYLETLE